MQEIVVTVTITGDMSSKEVIDVATTFEAEVDGIICAMAGTIGPEELDYTIRKELSNV